jgi:hypothetical protein
MTTTKLVWEQNRSTSHNIIWNHVTTVVLLCYRSSLTVGGIRYSTVHLGPVDVAQVQWFYPPATGLTNGELHVLGFLALYKLGVVQ